MVLPEALQTRLSRWLHKFMNSTTLDEEDEDKVEKKFLKIFRDICVLVREQAASQSPISQTFWKPCGKSPMKASNTRVEAVFTGTGRAEEIKILWDVRARTPAYELATGNNRVEYLAWDSTSNCLYAATECSYQDRMGYHHDYRRFKRRPANDDDEDGEDDEDGYNDEDEDEDEDGEDDVIPTPGARRNC